MTTAAEVKARFDAAPMSRLRIRAVALTTFVSALDGYDSLSMSFAAPAIALAWHVDRTSLGLVLSSGLAGVAIGSIALAPLADLVGRRPMVLAGIALMGVASLLCAYAGSLLALATWRLVTGLGIGVCVAVINPVAAEFANARRRTLAMSAMAVGYPAGGLAGGLLASWLLVRFAWPSIFLAGFLAAVILYAATATLLPESLAFLLGGARDTRLPRLNRLLSRTGQTPLAAMPERDPAPRGYAGLFAGPQTAHTARLALVSVLFAATGYFVLTWLPQMASDAGIGAARASLVAAVTSLAGIVACLTFGATVRRGAIVGSTVVMLVGFGLTTAAFGLSPAAFVPLLAMGAGCGLFLYGASTGFYTTLPISFPDEARASGIGFVIGIGRIASAMAPFVAGWLFASGFGRAQVCAAFALLVIAAALILAGHRLPATCGEAGVVLGRLRPGSMAPGGNDPSDWRDDLDDRTGKRAARERAPSPAADNAKDQEHQRQKGQDPK